MCRFRDDPWDLLTHAELRGLLGRPVGRRGCPRSYSVSFDILIRGGIVADGTGAPVQRLDIGIAGTRIVAAEPSLDGSAGRVIDASNRLVTPGFVDIHTHLDAQLSWDPVGTSSCWHGVTSVVMGNCGVTFAPCKPEDRSTLAEMMESVEDIPRDAILNGLAWDWETYGEYLASIGRMPKGLNVGGMVGHCALRQYVMGDRGVSQEPASAEDIAAMADLLDEAMSGGALGISTSRTFMHKIPDGRPVPGTYASTDELFAFADVLRRHGSGVFESASRLGERDSADLVNTRAELAWMGEVSRRSGRPVTFGLTQSDRRPDLYRRVVDFAKEENAVGGSVRPQTTARGVGLLFGLETMTPFDRSPAWRALKQHVNGKKLLVLRDPAMRQRLIDEAETFPPSVDLDKVFVLPPSGEARYDCRESDSLGAYARERGICAAGAYIELLLETNGHLILNMPFLNQQLDAVEEMLDDPLVTLGLADAGAHVGQIMDASQPTFYLTYWVRERRRWSIAEAVRRLTSDTAELFGIKDRGVIREGAFADINVIDFDNLTLHQPTYVRDFPNNAGRYVQNADGYDYTLVNGEIFMDHGQHTGALNGQMLTS
jgi:N-acyl-D-amino-acid deacylase